MILRPPEWINFMWTNPLIFYLRIFSCNSNSNQNFKTIGN